MIKLTEIDYLDGRLVYVSPDKIQFFYLTTDDQTYVQMIKCGISVKETPEKILEMLSSVAH